MTPQSITSLAVCCASAGLITLLGGCGMKGPLRHPAPPPADAQLAAPPSVTTPPDSTPGKPSQP